MTATLVASSTERLLIAEATRDPESLAAHEERVGPLPHCRPSEALDCIERSGLRGRGGAWFPTAVKWRAVERATGDAVVVVNAAEGEPASRKDETLLRTRPHLVLDGAVLAARTVGADDVIVYVRASAAAAHAAVTAALAERDRRHRLRWHLVTAPDTYVAGEETAVVRRLNGGPARPVAVPPRPYERGVGGRPTLVQNTETLAHAALILRHGAEWFRGAGTASCPGTSLFTVWTARRWRVVETELGTPLAVLLGAGDEAATDEGAVLLGGYFGSLLAADRLDTVRLDEDELRATGVSLGCGVVAAFPPDVCPLAEASRIVAYLARESAGQCGPCARGLPAMAEAVARLVRGGHPAEQTLADIERWSGQVARRGACHHPDGAIRLLASLPHALAVEIARHAEKGPCERTGARTAFPGVPPVVHGNLRW